MKLIFKNILIVRKHTPDDLVKTQDHTLGNYTNKRFQGLTEAHMIKWGFGAKQTLAWLAGYTCVCAMSYAEKKRQDYVRKRLRLQDYLSR